MPRKNPGQQNMIEPTPGYPECEKMAAVHSVSQKIGEFIDWLNNEKSIVLALYPPKCEFMGYDGLCFLGHDTTKPTCCPSCDEYKAEETDRLWPIDLTTEKLLAEFFEIDLDKIEKERQEMLDDLQKIQEDL